MNFQDEEILRICGKAVLPDSMEKQKLPTCTPVTKDAFARIAGNELGNYCGGLERQLIRLQQNFNREQAKAASEEKKRLALLNEIETLRWQIEYDKNLLQEIRTSRSWVLARMFHYLYGYLTLNKNIIYESKNDFDDLLVRKSSSDSPNQAKIALFFRYLLNGATKIAKKVAQPSAIGAGNTDLPEAVETVYGSFYQENEIFGNLPEDLKTVVFYLPQFHTFPENDQWWGKGFTEWTNTSKSQPRFPGHYQPRTPHQDIGYYDLANIETMKKQAALAKQHGIDYFCFYYYWFDGKKLMEKPLEQLIAHPEIPMNFCLCWANENWTRAWDGQQKEVLIQQNYSSENDINFIRDLKKYITDPRYMRCQGKPVILIYHTKILPDADRTFATWRKWCRENGIGEIQIWSCRTFIKTNEFQKSVEVDREVEFPPHMVTDLELLPSSRFHAYKEDGFYYNYRKIIQDLHNHKTMADHSRYPYYRCAMLGWDNSCRRATGYSVWQYFSLTDYHYWLRQNIEYTRQHFLARERFIFINAWNEWAEGTYLEPDERYGYASINTTTRALCDLPAVPEYEVLKPFAGPLPQPGKILIHLHIFYPDLMPEFIHYLNQMPFEYDCVMTTDSREKVSLIKKALKEEPLIKCRENEIVVTVNCGRDIAPFFSSCRKRLAQYDYIGHFHTKKSLTVNWGDEWRHYLLDQLLGSEESIRAVFRRFERERSLGLFFPTPHPGMRHYMSWEKNRERCERLLVQMKLAVKLPDRPLFPVGQMFWAKRQAIAPLFAPGIVEQSAFEKEDMQLSDTLAHATERLWKYVAEGCGYTTLAGVFPPRYPEMTSDRVRRLALFVHYSADQQLSGADLYLIKALKKSADVVFISNGNLNKQVHQQLAPFVKKIITRKNRGYDFGAWRDALTQCSLAGYDELVLLNNSILGPFCSFEAIFSRMANRKIDFWGMSEFPKTHNPCREEAKALPNGVIPRHIQSYFMVFKRQVFQSQAFQKFWDNVQDETTLPNVVAHCETQLSNVLEKAGFKSDVYLRTAARLQEIDTVTPEYNAIYCRPQDFLVLGFPFLKKNICYYQTQPQINETIHLIAEFCAYPVHEIKITAKTR